MTYGCRAGGGSGRVSGGGGLFSCQHVRATPQPESWLDGSVCEDVQLTVPASAGAVGGAEVEGVYPRVSTSGQI